MLIGIVSLLYTTWSSVLKLYSCVFQSPNSCDNSITDKKSLHCFGVGGTGLRLLSLPLAQEREFCRQGEWNMKLEPGMPLGTFTLGPEAAATLPG